VTKDEQQDEMLRVCDSVRSFMSDLSKTTEDSPEGQLAFTTGVRLWYCEFEPFEAMVLQRLWMLGLMHPADYDHVMRTNKLQAIKNHERVNQCPK